MNQLPLVRVPRPVERTLECNFVVVYVIHIRVCATVSARFDDKDLQGGDFSEASCHRGTGEPCAHNDVVERLTIRDG